MVFRHTFIIRRRPFDGIRYTRTLCATPFSRWWGNLSLECCNSELNSERKCGSKKQRTYVIHLCSLLLILCRVIRYRYQRPSRPVSCFFLRESKIFLEVSVPQSVLFSLYQNTKHTHIRILLQLRYDADSTRPHILFSRILGIRSDVVSFIVFSFICLLFFGRDCIASCRLNVSHYIYNCN